MRDQHLSLHLDSEQVILRSIGDEEPEPAVLSGSIVLDLHERTHINDILLVFNGRAHIAYTDTNTYKTHNFDIPIFHHDQSFLPSFTGPASVSSGSRPGSSAPSRRNSFNVNNNSSSNDTSSSANANDPSSPHGAGVFGTGASSASSSSANLHASHGVGSGSGSPSSHIHHATSAKAFHHPHNHGHSHHAHTLNAGVHRFPFAITIPGSLPASIRVAGINSSTTSYQLKVTVQKSGVFGGKWSVKRPVLLVRGLSPEAAEFNQTLEIDNTWPNKIMYNFTLPQKAYCAGETIPIALKFTPIAKGVRVTQLVTNIKEHVTVLNKNSQPHNTTRDIITKKHNFVARSTLSAHNSASGQPQGSGTQTAGSSTLRAHPVSVPPSRSGSHHDLASLNQQAARLNFDDHPALAGGALSTSPAQGGSGGPHLSSSPSHPTSGTSSVGAYTPASGQSSTSQSRVGSRANSPERIYYGRHITDPEFAGLVDDDAGEEVDVDAVIEIPIPMTASPSHALEPIMVSHKIKWSAFIKNLDGHTSELRCALPIHILSPLLVEEARLASSGTRSLLFGPSGVLVPAAEGIQQVDLPSYADHVRDRVANIDTASIPTTLAGSHGSSQQASSAFVRSPWASPVTSPEHQIADSFGQSSDSYFPGRTINWADSELLGTLALQSSTDANNSHHHSQNSSSHGSPATSRPGSRPGSRGGSRQNSRPASRASSPVRGESTNHDGLSVATEPHHANDADRPSAIRSASSGFLSHLPKPLRPFTALGGASHSGPPSAHISRTSTVAADERSHSTGSLSNFFHNHSGRSAFSRHSIEHPLGNSTLPVNGVQSEGDSDGPRPDALQAALEAAQRKQENQDKGKRRAHFSLGNSKGKGKQRASIFSHMHETDDEDHEHDVSDDHLAPHQDSPLNELPSNESPAGEDDTGARILSQVPSYQVASRGFLGGGVVPISAGKGLPSYDESETLSRPGSPLTRTDTSATRSSTSTTGSANSRGSRGRASISSLR